MKIYLKSTLALIILASLIGPLSLSAQVGEGFGPELTLEISPAAPRPLSNVTGEVQYFLSDIQRANISWYVNGALQAQGIGLTTFSFKTGPAGSATTLEAVVQTREGERLSVRQVIRPAEVDLLWEAGTYTPPAYRGKALITPGSSVKIVAIPHFISAGGPLSGARLVYNWRRNFQADQSASGYGRDSYTLQTDILEEETVQVEVSSLDNSLRATAQVTITAGNPVLLLYQELPLGGPQYQRALLGSASASDRELSIRAEPYFFSLHDVLSGLVEYQWKINGEDTLANSDDGRTLIMRAAGQAGAEGQVSLEASNPDKFLQSASASLVVRFSQLISRIKSFFSPPEAEAALKDYTLLEPIGSRDSRIPSSPGGLKKYLETIFIYAIIVAAFLAVVEIVIGGVQYAVVGVSESAKSDAKDRITKALLGLLLALSAWLILNTINPNLLNLSLELEPLPPEEVVQPPPPPPPTTCNKDSLFEKYSLPSNWPVNSPALNTLISGIQNDSRIKGKVNLGEVSTFSKAHPECNYTRGNLECGAQAGECHRPYSAHYGRTTDQCSEAVDFGMDAGRGQAEKQYGDLVVRVAKEKGAILAGCENSNQGGVACTSGLADHVHIEVATIESCQLK